MANSWKFMLKKNQLTCFLFNMNFHEYSMNFHKLLYKPFLFFYLIMNYALIVFSCKVTDYFSDVQEEYFILRGWCSSISCLRVDISMWVYISVVPMLSCPSRVCITLSDAPPSSSAVAKECRRVCGDIVFLIPAMAAYCFIIMNIMVRVRCAPRRLRNT